MSDGKGCKCYAACACECVCGADWMPKEVYQMKAILRDVAENVEVKSSFSAALEKANSHYRNLGGKFDDSTFELIFRAGFDAGMGNK